MCGLAPVSVQLRREQGSAQGVGPSLFNKNVGKSSDEARVVGAEINHAVVFRASGELAGVFLGVSVDQHPLGIAYHSPADGHGLLGNTVLKDFQPLFLDRKSTRLNSSHVAISYSVFCL